MIVDEEFPFPANSGKRLRTLNLVSRLAHTWQITYVANRNVDDEEFDAAAQHLESLGVRPVAIDRKIPSKSGLGFYGRLAANLFSKLPYSVSTHVSGEMLAQLKAIHQENDVLLWHCEWTPYAELFRHFDATPLVIAAHNVESLIWRRYGLTEPNVLKRVYINHQRRKFERFERWAFQRATRTIFVSDDDVRLAQQRFAAERVAVVENGVDVEQYQSLGHTRCRHKLIFLGSLDWRPNLDGIRCFLETAFPEIVQAHPKTILQIVGRNPGAWLIKLAAEHPNIELHSNVSEVVPFLSGAGMMVVPLRLGGGSRLKIIEAAANGLPVISTRLGAEGLRFKANEHYLATGQIKEMSQPVTQAIENYDSLVAMADLARAVAERYYDWNTLAERQSELWRMAICDTN